MVVLKKDFGKFERLSSSDIYEVMEDQPESIDVIGSIGFVAGGSEIEFFDGKNWYRISCYDVEVILQ